MENKSLSDQIKRTYEARAIGLLELLRVNLDLFIEEIKEFPPKSFPEKFAAVLIDAEALRDDTQKALRRDEEITDEMVEAAKNAMSWEGSPISVEDQSAVMREVLSKALASRGEKTILL